MSDEIKLEFGKGLISGYISALLGILSLMGVICFYYPSMLTSEQFRAVYSTDVVRWILFFSLIIAYFMGVISFVLNRSKKLALVGILTAFVATLAGGSAVEVKPYESTPYSFGLDWFALGLIFSMLIFIPIEKSFALNKEQKILRKGWRTDLAYFFVSHLLIQFIMLFVTYFSETLFGWAAIPLVWDTVRAMPIWLQFIVATFMADLSQYTCHRFHHKVRFLWRFHAVHHSAEHMDWLAGSRTHLVEIMMTRALVMLPLYLLGFEQAALNAYITLVGVQAVAIHANLGINFGWLRYIIATPQFHHWHHAKDHRYMDANYAVHLPVIDMIFGTYRCPKGEWPEEYGIVSGKPPEGFWGQLVFPFKKRKKKKTK